MDSRFQNALTYAPWLKNYYHNVFSNSLILNPNQEITKKTLISHLEKNWKDLDNQQLTLFINTIREYKNSCLLSIIHRDINGLSNLKENLNSLSALAEVCTQLAYKYSIFNLIYKNKRELFPTLNIKHFELFIVAMGKLGGGELNPSSDIDLIFLSDPNLKDEDFKEINSYYTLADKVVRQTIHILSRITENGICYRVDIRLKPYGATGPMIYSLNTLNKYFKNNAQNWERFAWVKARVINEPILKNNDEFQESISKFENVKNAFVYRPYLDFNIVDSLKKLSRKIKSHHKTKSRNKNRKSWSFNVKLDDGGIRDIELLVQLHQLIRGGNYKFLQTPSTLSAIEEVSKMDIFSRKEREKIDAAYKLYRQVEHRLQYYGNRQTHQFESNTNFANFIALSLNFKNERELVDELKFFKKEISGFFNKSFGLKKSEILGGDGSSHEDRNISMIRIANLQNLIAEKFDDQDIIKYFSALISSVKGRQSYLSLLETYPEIIAKISEIVKISSWAGNYIKRYPSILDQLLREDSILKKIDFSKITVELKNELSNLEISFPKNEEGKLNFIRDFHHNYLFRLLIQDLQKLWTIEELSDQLSELAEIVLAETLNLAFKSIDAQHLKTNLAVVAYGKLGGRELGFASDLDLIFLTKDVSQEDQPILIKIIKRFISWLSAKTAAGNLFTVDTRIRPNGTAGLLVTSIEGFEDYQNHKAWVWEHQAITRARFCGGDPEIGKLFESIRNKVISKKRSASELLEEVYAMRNRVIDENKFSKEPINIKTTAGGMVDIEFSVQALVLCHGHEVQELKKNIGNIALLNLMSEKKLLPKELTHKVIKTYSKYRIAQHRLRLTGNYNLFVEKDFSHDRKITKELWDFVFSQAPKNIRTISEIRSVSPFP
ncbi:MAG: hypothetical protein CBC42_03485 [Betaproteobacteria bacterium TMED82]|nr:MAG: hypothetical protein CBC42_03485 [Betaproteobacteria bacterium TMED82]|tara:strand:- start:13192 stop:15861 length:2670 start_codon:yes stop_codon:yes gene_type:complete